mmetsp:Transcript_106359/g.243492  ORF Transcript_106359/g.243492 Transcript_106359/m.243492 type:complete len:548 (+) Transcript_106359:58-1701(+)
MGNCCEGCRKGLPTRKPSLHKGGSKYLDSNSSTNNGLDRETLLRSVDLNRQLRDYYDQVHELGSGRFGKVTLMRSKSTGHSYAVKSISIPKSNSKKDANLLRAEISALVKLDHINIVRMVDYFEDRRFVYLVQEALTGGNLLNPNPARTRDVNECTRVFRQILGAIWYCHDLGVVHRDLKPENILYESGRPAAMVKLLDFGLAAVLTNPQNRMRFNCGTPWYLAPEVVGGSSKPYNSKCDMWPIGIMLCMFFTGEHPFFGSFDSAPEWTAVSLKSDFNISIKQQKKVPQGCLDRLEPEVADLVLGLLQSKPEKRLSAQHALEKPFFKKQAQRLRFHKVAEEVTEALRTFACRTTLERAILTVIAMHSSCADASAKLREDFAYLDKDGDGSLSLEELESMIQDPNLAEVFDKIDMDGSRSITFTEFEAAAVTHVNETRVREAFDYFDSDQSGAISRDEFGRIFGRKELDEAMQWLRQCGLTSTDQDEITFEQFKFIVQQAAGRVTIPVDEKGFMSQKGRTASGSPCNVKRSTSDLSLPKKRQERKSFG